MKLRPSAAATWMVCKGQPALVQSLALKSSDSFYAAEGRIAHRIAAECLSEDKAVHDYLGTKQTEPREDTGETVTITIDEDFVAAVDTYVKAILDAANGKLLFVEQSLDLSKVLQQPDQSGTGDAVIIGNGTIEIHDLKFGRGEPVPAKGNRQLLMYAAGTYAKFKDKGPFSKIKMVIHQPRFNAEPDSWTITPKALAQFIQLARAAAAEAVTCTVGEKLVAGEKQCRWCPAKAQCPALEKVVREAVEQEPGGAPLEKLGELRALVGLVQDWASAVCDATHKALEAGLEVPGWKLVAGRKGSRKWADEEKAAERIKKFRLKKEEMYKFILRSPTEFQKILTEARYQSLNEEGHIVQAEGKPTVAPADSKKEGLTTAVAFENLDEVKP